MIKNPAQRRGKANEVCFDTEGAERGGGLSRFGPRDRCVKTDFINFFDGCPEQPLRQHSLPFHPWRRRFPSWLKLQFKLAGEMVR
jgi:hypothetical protein